MERTEKINRLQDLSRDENWALLKEELQRMIATYEGYRDSALTDGYVDKAKRLHGIIHGLELAISAPEGLVNRYQRNKILQRAEDIASGVKESIQSIFEKAFKDFPV